jgi:hypothetical protein
VSRQVTPDAASTELVFRDSTVMQTPCGIAIDSQGRLLVTSQQTRTLLRIDPNAPNPRAATVLASNLNNPWAITVDQYDNAYITGPANSCVYKVPANGGAAIIFYDGTAAGANPNGIAIDANYDLFWADYSQGAIFKLNTQYAILGNTVQPTRVLTGLSGPIGVFIVPDGRLIVTTIGNGRVTYYTGITATPMCTVSVVPIVQQPLPIQPPIPSGNVCPAGTFSDDVSAPGRAPCKWCPPGQSSSRGDSSCKGKYLAPEYGSYLSFGGDATQVPTLLELPGSQLLYITNPSNGKLQQYNLQSGGFNSIQERQFSSEIGEAQLFTQSSSGCWQFFLIEGVRSSMQLTECEACRGVARC